MVEELGLRAATGASMAAPPLGLLARPRTWRTDLVVLLLLVVSFARLDLLPM